MSALTVAEVLDRAAEQQEREWTLWSDQRCPNERGSYRFRATFNFLGLVVTAEWTEELYLCGMGFGDSEWWPLKPCYWDGYRRSITISKLWWSPVQAYDPDEVQWHGLELLPCPFTGKPAKIEPQGQYIGAPLWRSEAVWISSPGVPKRRWTDAKAMQAFWNARAACADAAAPDLLAALEGAMCILGSAESNASGNPEWSHVGPRVAACRAAVAKARGL